MGEHYELGDVARHRDWSAVSIIHLLRLPRLYDRGDRLGQLSQAPCPAITQPPTAWAAPMGEPTLPCPLRPNKQAAGVEGHVTALAIVMPITRIVQVLLRWWPCSLIGLLFSAGLSPPQHQCQLS
jgi:hypothetical protein